MTALVAVLVLAGVRYAAERAGPDAGETSAVGRRDGELHGRIQPVGLGNARAWTPPWPSSRRARATAPCARPTCSSSARTRSTTPLSSEIAGLDGVAAVTPISLAQVTIENRAVNVAAVDPATYRLFTVREVAEAGDLGPGGRRRARRDAAA